MGGCNIYEDITNIMFLPVYVNDHADKIQGTAYSNLAFGPVFGTKSIGEAFTIGFMALPAGSGSSVLRGNFYSVAKSWVDEDDLLGNSFPTIPHALFGANFGAMSFGLDFFIERTKYSNTELDSATEDSEDIKIANVGGIASAKINIGKFYLAPLFGFSKLNAKMNSLELDGNNKTEEERGTEDGLFMKLGGEFGMELPNFYIVSGIMYTTEGMKFNSKVTTSGTTTETVELFKRYDNYLDIYLGIIAEPLSNLLFVAQYDLTFYSDKKIWNDTCDEDSYNRRHVYHHFGIGVERPVKIWIFDALTPRAGLSCYIEDLTSKTWNPTDDKDEEKTKDVASVTGVNVNVGFGISKGIMDLDVDLTLGAWDGAVTGPSSASATLTIDFGRSGSSRSSTQQTESAPAVETEPSNNLDGNSDFNF